FYALAFFQHRRYEQFLSEYKLIFHLNRLLVVRILHKQSAQNRKTGIISLSAVGIQIWEKLILQFDGRYSIFFGYFTKDPRLYRIVTFVMCTAQRIKDSELHPAGIQFCHSRIICNISTIARNIGRPERYSPKPGGNAHRNLVGKLPPTLQDIRAVSAIARPAKCITLQSGISCPGHLKHPFVGIMLLNLLFHNLIPSEAVYIVNLIVHTDMVLHIKTVGILFVTPSRFTHIRPKPMRTVG